MKLKKRVILSIILMTSPIIIISAIIFGRKMITPTNEDVLNKLKNIRMYSCDVSYTFKNIRDEFKEETKQYYRFDKGSRIEFKDYYKRIKVYNGSEIKVEENDNKYTLDKNLDIIYPLAFIENIMSNEMSSNVSELEEEWGDREYLKVNIQYSNNNKYLSKGEFYIDKKQKIPVMLIIFDANDKERVLIEYKNFKYEKILNENLF